MNRRPFAAALLALALAACNKSVTSDGAPGAPVAGGSSGAESSVVATYDDKRIALGELDQSLAHQLYDLRRQGLESLILERLMEQQAKAQGKSEEQLLKDVEEQAINGVSEAELRQRYQQDKESFGGRDFEQAKPMLKAAIGEQAVMAYLEQLKQQHKVRITLPEPRAQVAAIGPSKGPADAPVTIVEFSDFQCPYCARAVPTMEQLVANYAGKVRLVFRHFPLSFHESAGKAAEAALCADQQGKFWPMHDVLFARQASLEVDDLRNYAKSVGLDEAKFNQCLDSGSQAAKVQQDLEAGRQAAVESTPAFLVNGRLVMGAQPYERFKQLVDEELGGRK